MEKMDLVRLRRFHLAQRRCFILASRKFLWSCTTSLPSTLKTGTSPMDKPCHCSSTPPVYNAKTDLLLLKPRMISLAAHGARGGTD